MLYKILMILVIGAGLCANDVESKISEYCTKKASEFKSKRLYQHTFDNCNKETLAKNLSSNQVQKLRKRIESSKIKTIFKKLKK